MIHPIVTVTVDRPLGSYHPEHSNIYYPINYGYIKGTLAADGEEEDAYVLGVTEPVSEFTGKIIAIIKRENDVEHKWVVAPEGMLFTREEIAKSTYFQERYFKSTIELLNL
ncbi:MAG: inorganic pyrophosphatase [Clostridia bacterium]|nr:inorganic pyrophosphatase [Clostridia bacterium]